MDFHRKGVNVLWKGKLLSVVIKKISIVPQTIFIFSVKKDEKTVKPCDRSTTDSPRVEITAIIFGSKRERERGREREKERERKRHLYLLLCSLSPSLFNQFLCPYFFPLPLLYPPLLVSTLTEFFLKKKKMFDVIFWTRLLRTL